METWTPEKVNDFLAGFHFTRPKDFQSFDGARLVNARVSTFVQMGYRWKEAMLLIQAVEDLKVFLTPAMNGTAREYWNDLSTQSLKSDSGKNYHIERYRIKDPCRKLESWTPEKVNAFLAGFHFTRPKDFLSFDGARLVKARVSTFVQMGYRRKEARLLIQAVEDLKVFLTPAMNGPVREHGNDRSTQSLKSGSGKNYNIERIQSPKRRATSEMGKSEQKMGIGKKKPLSKVQMLIARANANPAPPPVMIKKIKKKPGSKPKAIPKPVPQENVVVLSTVKPRVPRPVSDPNDRERPSRQIISKPVPGKDAVSLSSVKPKGHHNLMPPSDAPSSGSSRRPSDCSSASSIKDRICAYRGSFQANEKGHRERIRAMKSAKKKERQEAVKNIDKNKLQEVISGVIERKKRGDVPEFMKTMNLNTGGKDLAGSELDVKDLVANMSKHLEDKDFLVPVSKRGEKTSAKQLTMNNSKLLEGGYINSGEIVYKSFCDSLLAQKDTLTAVNLNGCGLNDKFIAYLCPVLMELQLEELTLESNDIRKNGVLLLADVIRRSPKLRVFKMTNQRNPVPTIAYEQLFEAIRESSSLVKISVDFREQLHKDQVFRITRSNQEKLRIARREAKKM